MIKPKLFICTSLLPLFFSSLVFSADKQEDTVPIGYDVSRHAQALVEIFLNHPYGGYEIYENDASVGSLAFDKENRNKVYVDFRGARSPSGNFSCIRAGTGPIHKGFLEGYRHLKPSLFTGVKSYLKEQELSWEELIFSIAGHSRGSTFAPLLATDIADKGAKVDAVYTFSLLGVFVDTKVEKYNTRFSDIHVNFLAKEDKVDSFFGKLQKIISFGMSSTYKMPGNTKAFCATDFPEFNKWVEGHPYIHLATYGFPAKWFLSPYEWRAHMPEAYAMLTPKVFESMIDY